jgi:hypothetical protein
LRRIFLIFLIIGFYSPLVSLGTNSTIYLEADKDIIKKGEQVEVSFNIKGEKIVSYLANIYFDEAKFELISNPQNIKVDGNVVKILWYDEQGGIGAKQGELGKLVFKAKENGLANFVIDGEFYNENMEVLNTNFESLQIEIGENGTNDAQYVENENNIKEQSQKSFEDKNYIGMEEQENLKNTNLETLAIEGALLYPPFDNNITEYNTEVSNDVINLNILAVSENEEGKTEIFGKDNLKEGNNTIIVKVTAKDGITKKEYRVNVYRRNLQEEETYKEEQKLMVEKLENAYEIEKVSVSNENNMSDNKKTNKKNNKYIFMAIGSGIIVVSIVKGISYYRKKKK